MAAALNWSEYWPDAPVLTLPWRQLLQAPSLTAALRPLADFSIEVRHQGEAECSMLMTLPESAPQSCDRAYVREVYLCLAGTPVVWAKSLCAVDAAFWVSYLQCGTQPLGARLFDGTNSFTRSTFYYAYGVHPECPDKQPLWARRSVFRQQSQQQTQTLDLVEVFLPALHHYVA